MITQPPKILIAPLVLSGLSAARAGGPSAKAELPPPEPPSREWQWNVGLGAAWRQLGRIQFHSGQESSGAFLPGLRPSLTSHLPGNAASSGIGPAGAHADRTYRDGFVFRDDDTANPASFFPGTTAYWGYQSDAQVSGGSLFYDGGSYGISSLRGSQSSRSGSWDTDAEGTSPVLEAEAFYPVGDHLSLGGTFSFLFINTDVSRTGTTFRAFQSLSETVFTVTDRYDLQGIVPPAAPYAGTYSHPGTAPLIDNIPAGRIIAESGRAERSATYFNTVSESLEINLQTFSLGPSLRYETGRLILSGSLGLAVNVADWEASHVERLYRQSSGRRRQLREWRDHSGKTSILPAFYIQGSAGCRISDRWALSVFGRQDWSKTLSGSVGPSNFSVDPGGYTLGAAVTFNF